MCNSVQTFILKPYHFVSLASYICTLHKGYIIHVKTKWSNHYTLEV